MSINKPNPEILKAFWFSLSRQQQTYILLNHNKQYNDFLNGEPIDKFSKPLRKVINLNKIFTTSAAQGLVSVIKACLSLKLDVHYGQDHCLRVASENGHLEAVKCLIENGADIHTNNDLALRYAAKNGHLEIVKYLVEKGADIHAEYNGAFRWAAERCNFDVVYYLQSLMELEHVH